MWRTLEEWREQRSSKWGNIADVTVSITKCDARHKLPRINERGVLEIQEITPEEEGSTSKILIYFDFTGPIEHLVAGLRFEGLHVMVLTGKNSDLQRANTLREFEENPRAQVLVMSSVGNAGLNLQCVNHVIFGVSISSLSSFQ